MKTLRFAWLAAAVVACAPQVCVGQAANLPRVGFVLSSAQLHTMTGEEPAEPVMRGFVHGLRALGYADGKNIRIERRSAEGRLERQEALIRELAESRVAAIVVTGNPMALIAMKVTQNIPIVVAGMGAPAESGIVRNLARPEANVTGLAVDFGAGLGVKRLEQLRDIVPAAHRVAYLGVQAEWDAAVAMRAAAQQMGITLYLVDARLPRIDIALRELEQNPPDALFVAGAAPLFVHRKAIVDFAGRARVPDFHLHAHSVADGGLLSYGHDSHEIFRRAAGYVDRILKGAKPADLPVEQIERFSLVVNLRRAKAIGITIPPSVLLRADRVIE
jgi:ABC-type uncharacterized transport system substrate-binding protein